MIWYHGTSYPQSILEHGFDLSMAGSGVLGIGIYLGTKTEAMKYGEVLKVEIDEDTNSITIDSRNPRDGFTKLPYTSRYENGRGLKYAILTNRVDSQGDMIAIYDPSIITKISLDK